jgi:hypothetical protein
MQSSQAFYSAGVGWNPRDASGTRRPRPVQRDNGKGRRLAGGVPSFFDEAA